MDLLGIHDRKDSDDKYREEDNNREDDSNRESDGNREDDGNWEDDGNRKDDNNQEDDIHDRSEDLDFYVRMIFLDNRDDEFRMDLEQFLDVPSIAYLNDLDNHICCRKDALYFHRLVAKYTVHDLCIGFLRDNS